MAQSQIEAGALGREVAQAHFSRLYREQGRAVLAYALRRVADREDAADVVAETFLVARRVIANQHRTERRRTRLGRRLAESLRTELSTHPGASGAAAEVLRAMSRLGADDRELLLLVSWEELTPGEAAKVLGISSIAARSRLHRARRRLRALIDDHDSAEHREPTLDTEEAR